MPLDLIKRSELGRPLNQTEFDLNYTSIEEAHNFLEDTVLNLSSLVEDTSKTLGVACSDETTALTSGTAKVTFRMPHAMTVTGIRASLTVAQTSGSILTVDVNKNGVSILSTKLTIDNTEKTSTTAVTPAVISDTALSDDSEITIDIDQVGDGTAKGLKLWLIGYLP